MSATSQPVASQNSKAPVPFAEYCHTTKTFSLRDGIVVAALADFSLEVHPGEVLVLMGPSGCGKSTALGLLAGHFSPTHGRVFFRGEAVEGPDPRRTIVFQQETLWPWRTVEGNLLFSLESRGLRRACGLRRLGLEAFLLFSFSRRRILERLINPAEAKEALEWLSVVGLKEFSEALPKQLSG